MYIYINDVSICAYSCMKFPFVCIHNFAQTKVCDMQNENNEYNVQTKECGQSHMQYTMLFVNILGNYIFPINSNWQ